MAACEQIAPPCRLGCDAFTVFPSSCDRPHGGTRGVCWALSDSARQLAIGNTQQNFYLLGNSVTRHYAFALKALLERGSNHSVTDGMTAFSPEDRSAEKAQCRGVLGDSSCVLPVHRKGASMVTNVSFLWKNTIGVDASTDDPRDVCTGWTRTADCVSFLFRHATRSDVLIVGSLLTDLKRFYALGGETMKSDLPTWAPLVTAGSRAANSAAVVRMLTDAFPGRILWHSYAVVNMDPKRWARGHPDWDVNTCFAPIDDRVRCVCDGSPTGRTHFINLRPLQQHYMDKYLDIIHHPGDLSKAIVFAMLAIAHSLNGQSARERSHVCRTHREHSDGNSTSNSNLLPAAKVPSGLDEAIVPTPSPPLYAAGGAWMAEYAALHARGKRAWRHTQNRNGAVDHSHDDSRYVIFIAREGATYGILAGRKNQTGMHSGGLADRTTGLITTFCLALLTRSVFLIDWPGLTGVYDEPQVKWACEGCADTALKMGAHDFFFPIYSTGWKLGKATRERLALRMIDNLTAHFSSAKMTVIRDSCGALNWLFSDRTRAAVLQSLGLSLSNAFRLLHNYLFAPTSAVIDAFRPEFAALEAVVAPRLNVLLQIRLGDAVLPGQSVEQKAIRLEDFAAHFACARTLGGPGATLFLMSDSLPLKELTLANRGRLGFHDIVTHVTRDHAPTLYVNYSQSALLGVVGEYTLASRCTRHAISSRSGLGLQAFFLSRNVTADNVRMLPDCSAVSVAALAESWSKV